MIFLSHSHTFVPPPSNSIFDISSGEQEHFFLLPEKQFSFHVVFGHEIKKKYTEENNSPWLFTSRAWKFSSLLLHTVCFANW